MLDRGPPSPVEPRTRSTTVPGAEADGYARPITWAATALVTVLIHVGVFWYLTHEVIPPSSAETPEDAAVMIDMSPEVQQAFSQTDLAQDKMQQEAAAVPPPPPDPTPDITPPVEDSTSPPVAPLPPKPPEKPKVVKKPEKKVEPRKDSKQAAAKTSGGPRSDNHAARTSAASAGSASSKQVADWKSLVGAALNRHKHYPSGSTAIGLSGIVMQFSASGVVTSVRITRTSGSSDLDNAALETVRASSPLPTPPPGTTSFAFNMRMSPR